LNILCIAIFDISHDLCGTGINHTVKFGTYNINQRERITDHLVFITLKNCKTCKTIVKEMQTFHLQVYKNLREPYMCFTKLLTANLLLLPQ